MPQPALPPMLPPESPPVLRLSRRRMLTLSGVTLASLAALLAAAGCSGGSLVGDGDGGDGGGGFSRAERLVVNPRRDTVADERGVETAFLGFLSSAPTGALAALWGTQDADGTPVRLTQSHFWDADPALGVRVVYDGQGLPTRVEHEENGAFALAFWESARATFKFYQPDGTYVGGAVVTPGGGGGGGAIGYDVAQLPDSQVVGYFTGTMSGLREAIVSFTVGGTATTPAPAPASAARGRADEPQGSPLTAAEAAQARRAVDALATRASETQAGFAGDLLRAVAEPLIATGQSELGTRILSIALQNTGVSPVFLNNGLPLLQGLATPFLVRAVAERVKAAWDAAAAAAETAVPPAVVGVAYSSPDPVAYRAANSFKTTRPGGDTTSLRGIVAAREIETVPVSGVIDAGGNVLLSGTAATGELVELRGTVVGDAVTNGRWTLKSAPGVTRDVDGDWDAERTPLGQCMQQALSGGQGFFTRDYDLGVCGDFSFRYEAFSIPDQFTIYQDDNVIFTTGGKVSGGSTVTVTAVGQTTLIKVVVTADESGTAWNYTVGCPQ